MTRNNVAIAISLAALAVALAALVLALRRAPMTPEQQAIAEALEAAPVQAQRIRSATQMRGMVIAVLAWAEAHDGGAPPQESWREALLDTAVIDEDMLTPKAGAPVETPFHHIRPTREQVAATGTAAGAQVVVFYEDPGLWEGAGGTLVTLDTGTQWIDGEAYAKRVEELSRP